MENTILTRAEKLTFKNLCSKLNIKTEAQQRAERFNEWMKKIGNVYYSDNEKMTNAFNNILEI